VVGGVLVVGGAVLALQTDRLVGKEMASNGVDGGKNGEADDDNCSQYQNTNTFLLPFLVRGSTHRGATARLGWT